MNKKNNATTKVTATKVTAPAQPKNASKEAAAAKLADNRATSLNELFRVIADCGLTPYSNERVMVNRVLVRAGKKTVAEVYIGKKDLRVNVKQVVMDSAKMDGYRTINNYYLPACKNFQFKERNQLFKIIRQCGRLYKDLIPAEAEA